MGRDKFVQEIGSVESRVESMAAHARGMLHDGVAALADLDRELAAEVMERADALAQMDEDIEREVLRMLTLQAPMAKDLRHLGAAFKLITYINRIGRYGFDIARVVRDWPEGREHVARMVSIREMAAKVETMLGLATQAFASHASPDTQQIMALEDDVDAMRYSTFRECLSYMSEDPRNIEPCAHYMMVARYLERCGDNIVKMTEKLHYALTGQRLLLK